ncbi:hypothetical protein NDU88_003065 [Pleurodeles waltl]|uniref:Uncharacterized protein n=1 Tax=Pleurodeles waltl TaxID=8319 RepID=A0AAV7NIU4_PLEWA|nr:hypothetical protein NDU88_003065 [Pleurodeles waltl]
MPGVVLRGKCPGGTSRLTESVEEGAGRFSNAPCRKDKESVCKMEECAVNVRQAGSSEQETKSQPGDGGTRRQAEEASPGDAEPQFKGESYISATARCGSPEENRYQETKKGEYALKPATF